MSDVDKLRNAAIDGVIDLMLAQINHGLKSAQLVTATYTMNAAMNKYVDVEGGIAGLALLSKTMGTFERLTFCIVLRDSGDQQGIGEYVYKDVRAVLAEVREFCKCPVVHYDIAVQ